MKVIIVTGGTGGHIYPALALADYMKDKNNDILFIGNDDRMEKDLIPQYGYRIELLHTSGLAGSAIDKVKACLQTLSAYNKAKKIIKNFDADVVIGFGGYVSAPVMLAAQSLDIPTIIHEQNSIVGKSNLLASKKAKAIITCYPGLDEHFNKEVHLLGNPRASEVQKTHDKINFEFKKEQPIGLIVMGSLGSETINEIMPQIIRENKHINFLYVTGKRDYQRAKEMYNEQDDNVIVMDYIDQMSAYPSIDFMICRSGATTCAEVCAAGIASIMIPSPYVANNHQYYNAKCLSDNHAAVMIEEHNVNAKTIQKAIKQVIEDDSIKNNALKMGHIDANDRIYELIEKIVGEK